MPPRSAVLGALAPVGVAVALSAVALFLAGLALRAAGASPELFYALPVALIAAMIWRTLPLILRGWQTGQAATSAQPAESPPPPERMSGERWSHIAEQRAATHRLIEEVEGLIADVEVTVDRESTHSPAERKAAAQRVAMTLLVVEREGTHGSVEVKSADDPIGPQWAERRWTERRLTAHEQAAAAGMSLSQWYAARARDAEQEARKAAAGALSAQEIAARAAEEPGAGDRDRPRPSRGTD